MSRRAFTLIELLVVMAIISILTSLLMPALGVARNQARAISCRSRLKQLHYAMTMYTIDHRQYLPGLAESNGTQFFGIFTGATDPVDFEHGYLSSYVGGDAEIWQCPSFAEFLPRADGPCTGYAYNYHYLTELKEKGNWWDPDYSYSWQGLHESVVAMPSRTVVFGDSARNWMGPLEENWFWTPPSEGLAWPGWEAVYTHFRHRGRANVVWFDGHANSLEPSDAWPVDKDNLGVICDTDDEYFDPRK
jgi:prepilin-type N-terminal cleavage/methylation domain-containing protein/prepilin-type processing-associated H-X9-DG protein